MLGARKGVRLGDIVRRGPLNYCKSYDFRDLRRCRLSTIRSVVDVGFVGLIMATVTRELVVSGTIGGFLQALWRYTIRRAENIETTIVYTCYGRNAEATRQANRNKCGSRAHAEYGDLIQNGKIMEATNPKPQTRGLGPLGWVG